MLMRALVVLALLASLGGCAHVKPHEREALSRPSMDPSTEVGETGFQAHLRESREGATASSGAAGGGCGESIGNQRKGSGVNPISRAGGAGPALATVGADGSTATMAGGDGADVRDTGPGAATAAAG